MNARQQKMRFMKRAFIFFGIVWCVFLIISRILKHMKGDKKDKSKKEVKENKSKKEVKDKKSKTDNKNKTD